MAIKRWLVRETEMVKVVAVYSILAKDRNEAIEKLVEVQIGGKLCSDQDIRSTTYKTSVSPLDQNEEADMAQNMLAQAINSGRVV